MAGEYSSSWLEELEEAGEPESADSERDDAGTWLAFSFPIFIFTLISNPGVGAAHIQVAFPSSVKPLEMSSQACLEVCLLGDSKSSRVSKEVHCCITEYLCPRL